MQLTQVYSQKSTRTTFPRSCFNVSGGELSQVIPFGNAFTRNYHNDNDNLRSLPLPGITNEAM